MPSVVRIPIVVLVNMIAPLAGALVGPRLNLAPRSVAALALLGLCFLGWVCGRAAYYLNEKMLASVAIDVARARAG